ncbi:MAG: M23 family metallopeptidase [Solirubrobacterales bacterium]
MPRPAAVSKGEWVWEGESVGAVGKTGNAISVGCHLHFEVHERGVPVDPGPSLDRWDRYS